MNPTSEFNPLGVLRLLRSAGGAMCAQAALHSQLARVEWAEELSQNLKWVPHTWMGVSVEN